MSANTKIPWCHDTHNIWEGCTPARVLGGSLAVLEPTPEIIGNIICDDPMRANCYARTRNQRFHGGKHWGPGTPRLARSDKYWRQPHKWNKAAESAQERRRVFCSSLADVFERHDDPKVDAWMDTQRTRLWKLISETPHLDWLLLSKRPENFLTMVPWTAAHRPLPNIWLGVSAGTQQSADVRIPLLLDTPAVMRFVSAEPMLESVDFMPYLVPLKRDRISAVDQIIVGCESGPNARPFDLEWAREVRDQCFVTGTSYFLKQIPDPSKARGKVIAEPEIHGKQWLEVPE